MRHVRTFNPTLPPPVHHCISSLPHFCVSAATACQGFHISAITLTSFNEGNKMEKGSKGNNGIGEAKKNEKITENEEGGHGQEEKPPPLMAMNHVSRVCRNVKESVDFYTKVLGFVLIERPQVLDFEGAWLFNYGVGIHLVQSKNEDKLPSDTQHLDPMDNHISFQCEDMEAMEQKLKEMNVKYTKRCMEEDETKIDQLFFKDPDGYMVEICNCENLKLVPAGSLGKIKLPSDRHNPPLQTDQNGLHN